MLFLGIPRVEIFTHMLATPLTLLACSLETTAEDKSSHTNTRAALERMHGVIAFFNSTASLPEAEPFKLSELCTTVTSFYGERVVLCTQHDVQLTGPRFLLEEALFCLINNAMASQKKSLEPVYAFCLCRNDTLIFCLRDFGCGMNWWQKKLAGLPYVSFRKNGSGIGLPFARFVIKKIWNGDFHLRSEPGLGTEVTCVLPLNH